MDISTRASLERFESGALSREWVVPFVETPHQYSLDAKPHRVIWVLRITKLAVLSLAPQPTELTVAVFDKNGAQASVEKRPIKYGQLVEQEVSVPEDESTDPPGGWMRIAAGHGPIYPAGWTEVTHFIYKKFGSQHQQLGPVHTPLLFATHPLHFYPVPTGRA